MSGQMAATAPHLDGTEDIGVWFDVAWATYANMLVSLDRDKLDALEQTWDELAAELSADGRPTPETWGASEKAQQGQAAMMAMFGGGPGDMGMAPGVGDEG